jgi:hypothetical protein
MGCVLLLALVGLPRIGLIWLWLVHTGYVRASVGGNEVLPVLGFLFLPTTTLAWAYGYNGLGGGSGEMPPLGWLLVVIGLILDLGLHGGGAARSRRRRRRD